jgi:exodeoxyribonuclease VII large subunit
MHADWRRAAHRVELATAALRASSPVARVSNGRHRLERLEAQLRNEIRHALGQARHHLGEAVGRLDSLSPLAVLGRGYSLTRTPDGRIVRSARQVGAGDDVRVLLHEGSLECRVSAAKEHDDRPQV